jgi:hypothetical protein
MNVSELFPLSTALGSNYRNYYISRDLSQVYSTKRPGAPYAMTKTGTGRCRDTYWSLSNGGRFGNFTIRADDLAEKVRRSAEFKAWLQGQPGTQPNLASGRGYIIGSIYSDGGISFSSMPKVHTTELSAKVEVERLAKATPGNTYVYLEIKGKCKAGGVTWI